MPEVVARIGIGKRGLAPTAQYLSVLPLISASIFLARAYLKNKL